MNQPSQISVKRLLTTSLLFLSGLIVAFGQPARCAELGFFAGIGGFALAWQAIRGMPKGKFWWATAWYSCVQLIQLSWLTSTEYQGYYILIVYLFLAVCLGLQFGALTIFLLKEQNPCINRIFASAGLWTLFEWLRLFPLCGFSWNPVGLAMTGWSYPLQFASIGGVYGLTFWVILANGILFKAFVERLSRKWIGAWFLVLAVPCSYGYLVLHTPLLRSAGPQSTAALTVGLVQTGLMPSEKVPLPGKMDHFIAPWDQWKRIFEKLEVEKKEWDLLIFPEAVVPMGAHYGIYPFDLVIGELKQLFGEQIVDSLPPLHPPFAQVRSLNGKAFFHVSNIFIAQTLANHYRSEVVIGLDHHDIASGKSFNSAFYCAPDCIEAHRYDKQILLPLAEYLPFSWLKSLTQRYGIVDFFTHGEETSVLGNHLPFSLSICYEETFPHLMRQGKRKGAEFFINVTNDSYYPSSLLSEQHFSHAKVRAAENGVYLLRACNTGITAVIDSTGAVVSRLGEKGSSSETLLGVLTAHISPQSHPTLYAWWGDVGVIAVSLTCLLLFLYFKKKFPFSSPSFDLNLKKIDL
jgi:apolipoprotein N-acyltransferase